MLSDVRTSLDVVHALDQILGEALRIDTTKLEKKGVKLEEKFRKAILEMTQGVGRRKAVNNMYM